MFSRFCNSVLMVQKTVVLYTKPFDDVRMNNAECTISQIEIVKMSTIFQRPRILNLSLGYFLTQKT
jgi:hypothetical protein